MPIKHLLMKDYVKIASLLKMNSTSYLNAVYLNDLRIQYMESYFYTNPSHFKLKHLFQIISEKQLTDLAIYIYKVLL